MALEVWDVVVRVARDPDTDSLPPTEWAWHDLVDSWAYAREGKLIATFDDADDLHTASTEGEV